MKIHTLPFTRSPFSKSNITAYKQLKRLVKEGKYDVVHTHTPNASAIVRLACRKLRKKGLKIFYTAHGFHFYKGAPLKNWLVYYPIEKLCARWTDTLITINSEDYTRAKKKLHAKNVACVFGVGIDLSKFGALSVDKVAKCKTLGIPEDAKLFISVGELNDNKNHEIVIKALEDMNVYYVIAGTGNKKDALQALIDKQKMADRIKLIGYRTDIGELYAVSDFFVFPSFREGLSVSLMEAMACGLPCAVSNIRGNTDLIDENGGACFAPDNVDDVKKVMQYMCDMQDFDRKQCSVYNKEKIKSFSNETVISQMKEIYFFDK